MILLFVLLGVLFLSALAALWFHEQAGYVLINIGDLTIETSLFLALGLATVAVLVGYFLVRLLIRTVRAPGRMRGWMRRRRVSRSRDRLVHGLVRLAEGQYADAERTLIKAVPHSDTPVLHYLCAAWAAHREGAERRRDLYLAQADKVNPKARLAVGLIQAQLYLEQAQWETAFATLSFLAEKWPRQPRVLEMLAKSCVPLGEWDRLLRVLPQLRRQGTQLSNDDLDNLERRAAHGSLLNASRHGEQALTKAWSNLPKQATRDPDVILTYVDARMQLDAGDPQAEKLLKNGLRHTWRPEWIDRYGKLEMKNPAPPLANVQSWLKNRPEDATLLLTAGRLAMANNLWEKAREYLEAAVAREPTGEAYYLLACLQEQMKDTSDALYSFRRAAELGSDFRRPANLQTLQLPSNVAEAS